MEIMMGPTGYSQFKEMSSREDNEKIFIDLVRNNLFLFIKTGVHDYQMLCYLAIHLLCY